MAYDANATIKALIDAAVKLKLKAQIRASFFFGWAIPIAITGRAVPSPYYHFFYSAGAALALIGVVALLISMIKT